jgi:hypothetical protein
MALCRATAEAAPRGSARTCVDWTFGQRPRASDAGSRDAARVLLRRVAVLVLVDERLALVLGERGLDVVRVTRCHGRQDAPRLVHDLEALEHLVGLHGVHAHAREERDVHGVVLRAARLPERLDGPLVRDLRLRRARRVAVLGRGERAEGRRDHRIESTPTPAGSRPRP